MAVAARQRQYAATTAAGSCDLVGIAIVTCDSVPQLV